MDLNKHNQKTQFFTKIALAFLVIFGYIFVPVIARASVIGNFTEGAKIAFTEVIPGFPAAFAPASLASFWQGVTCFFGFNCPAPPKIDPQANSAGSPSTYVPVERVNNNKSSNNLTNTNDPAVMEVVSSSPTNNQSPTNISKSDPTHIIQNINPTKEIQTKEIQTIHTNTVTENTNTVVVDEDTKNKVNLLLRQLDSDRPNYSVGQTYTLPANLLGSTLNIGAGNFTISASGDANAQNITTEHDLTVRGNFSVTGTQAYTGAANFTSASASSTLTTANTGAGFALHADNITAKTNTLNTTADNLILNSNTGLIEIAGTGIKLTNSVPTDTNMALYNDSGTLKWNGAALAMGSSVSGIVGYVPKFTSSNALGNSVLFESAGNVGIGTTAPGQAFQVVGAAQIGDTVSQDSSFPNLLFVNNSTWDISGHASALRAEITVNPLVSGKVVRGITGSAISNASSTLGIGSLRGLDFSATHLGSGLAGDLRGIFSYATARGSGNVTNLYGGNFTQGSRNTFTGTISNLYGVRVQNIKDAGTITNSYGLYLDNVNQGDTNNYSIYSAGGQSYFAGNIGVGIAAPAAKLQVVGSDSLSTSFAANISGATGTGLVVQNNGWVGIGTTASLAPFSVISDLGVGAGEHTLFDFETNQTTGTGIKLGYWANGTGLSGGVIRSTNSYPLFLGTTNNKQTLTILDSGNVGIGAISPNYGLDVYGGFRAGNATSTAGLVFDPGTGRVGIGTTAPNYKLTAIAPNGSGVASFTANDSETVMWLGRADQTNRPLTINFPTTTSSQINAVYGSLTIYSDYSSTVSGNYSVYLKAGHNWDQDTITMQTRNAANSNYLDRMVITNLADVAEVKVLNANFNVDNGGFYYQKSSGNVGIGITSPSYKLDVNGAFNASATSTFAGKVGIGTNIPSADLQIAGSYASIAVGSPTVNAAQGGIYMDNNKVFLFGNAPAGVSNFIGNFNNNTGLLMKKVSTGAGDYLDIQDSSGNGQFVIKSSGNVGIGTTSPASKFTVVGPDDAAGMALDIKNSSGVSKFTVNGYGAIANNYFSASGGGASVSSNAGSLSISSINDSGTVFTTNVLTTHIADLADFQKNGTSLVKILNSGNVGIGTANPFAGQLHINKSASGTLGGDLWITNTGANATSSSSRLAFGSDGTTDATPNFAITNVITASSGYHSDLTISSYSATLGSYGERLRINGDNGNVGIGTTAPIYPLDVSATSGTKAFRFTNSVGAYTLDNYSFVAPSTLYITSPITLGLSAGAGNGVTFTTAGSERMRINTSGSVGIGTTAPASRLHVVGADTSTSTVAQIGGSSGTGLVVLNNGKVGIGTTDPVGAFDVVGQIRGSTGGIFQGVQLGYSNGFYGIYNGIYDYGITHWTGSAYRTDMVIKTDTGNVGIGTTNPSLGKLEVVKTDVGTVGLYIHGNGNAAFRVKNDDASGKFMDIEPTTGGANFQINDSNVLTLLNTGNIGIGTTSPGTRLDVVGDGITSATAAMNVMNASSTSALFIRNDGNVGIGTTAPGTKLDVNGSITSAANLYVSGSINSTYQINLGGNGNSTIGMVRNGSTNGADLSVYSGGAMSGGTNLNGGNFYLKSGISTGTGTSNLYFQTATAGSTGSVDNAPTTKMAILGNGNVGIGTTVPGAKLEVIGNAYIGSGVSGVSIGRSTGGYDGVGYNIGFTNGSDTFTYRVNDTASLMQYYNGGYRFRTAASGIAGNTIAFADAMSILSTGSVGIGTTAPTELLSLYGSSATNATLKIENHLSTGYEGVDFYNESGTRTFSFAHSNTSASLLPASSWLGTRNSEPLYFVVGTSPMMSLTTSGNVGIGTTAPAGKFTVRQDNAGYITDLLRLENLGTASSTTGVGMQFIANRTTGGATEFGRIDALATSIDNSYYSGAMRFKIAANGALETIAEFGNPNISFSHPLEVNVAGDTGINYDLQFMNNGESRITSAGPLTILAGSPNLYDDLTLATAGDSATNGGDIVADIRYSNTTWGGFKVLGADSGGYVVRVDPLGNLAIGGNGLGAGNLTVKQNVTLTGGNIGVQQLAVPASLTCAQQGTTGATTYRFQVTALNDNGQTTPSSICEIANGNAVLDTTNYVRLDWGAVSGAQKYYVYGCSGAACTPVLDNGTLPHVSAPAASFNVIDNTWAGTALPGSNTTGGKVGIGTTAYSYQLQLATDSAGKPGRGSWTDSSDERLKKNITPIAGALDKVMQLRGVNFEWVNVDDHGGKTGPQGGFIAQEVQKIFPNWVKEIDPYGADRGLIPENEKSLSLSLPFEYDALVVEAIKEQQGQINLLLQVNGLGGFDATSTLDVAQNNSGVADRIKSASEYLTAAVKDALVQLKEITIDKIFTNQITVKQMNMIDGVTGEPYCVMIMNGEWQKTKGACNSTETPPQAGGANTPAENPVPEPPAETIIPPENGDATTTVEIAPAPVEIIKQDESSATTTAS